MPFIVWVKSMSDCPCSWSSVALPRNWRTWTTTIQVTILRTSVKDHEWYNLVACSFQINHNFMGRSCEVFRLISGFSRIFPQFLFWYSHLSNFLPLPIYSTILSRISISGNTKITLKLFDSYVVLNKYYLCLFSSIN